MKAAMLLAACALSALVLRAAAAPAVQTDYVTWGQWLQDQPDSAFAADLDGITEEVNKGGSGAVRTMDAGSFPTLQSVGMSSRLINLPACAQRGPFIAPAYMLYVITGTNVTHVLLDSASKRSIVNELSDGYMAWKPAELMGYFFNGGCEPAQFLAVFNQADLSAGLDLFVTDTFATLMPVPNLAAGYGVDEEWAAAYKTKERVNSEHTNPECERACGLRA